MWQTAIVILILAATVFFAVRWIVRTAKGKGGCACGCTGCPKAGGKGECHCAERKKPQQHTIKQGLRR